MKQLIIDVIDFFYPPFRKFVPLQTFRYIACGGGNTALDIVLYYLSIHYLLPVQTVSGEEVVFTPIGAMTPHIAAFLLAFAVTFPIGFYLNRVVVFTGSTLRGRVQLARYFVLVIGCIVLNYVFLKLFVEELGFYPTVAKLLTTVIVVGFSYLTQKKYTFKVAKTPRPVERT